MTQTRDTSQRKQDVLDMLQRERDLWVVSASATGDAYIVPLSFSWDGVHLTVATPKRNRTARNLRRAGRARVALGPPTDVVILEGPVEEIAVTSNADLADAHTHVVGFDARDQPEEYVFIRLTPERIQAWRSPAELPDHDVMRAGSWLA